MGDLVWRGFPCGAKEEAWFEVGVGGLSGEIRFGKDVGFEPFLEVFKILAVHCVTRSGAEGEAEAE